METSNPIEQARIAKRDKDFPAVENILTEALRGATESHVREELLRQLFYLYNSPVYENLEEAQVCLAELDRLNPSAHNGMEWVMFFMNCKSDLANAKRWAQITGARAESENSTSALYTVTALAGLIAVQEKNLEDVEIALRKLDSLVGSDQELPLGDEVVFLEACMVLSDNARESARALASRTALRIEDPEFRKRAQNVADAA